MINTILSTYAKQMEQYISSFIRQPEGMVEVGAIASQGEEEPCKIQLFLLSVERETATGLVTGKGTTSGRFSGVSSPPVYANLNVIIASVFSDKRYKESLTYLSLAITFLQSTPYFTTGDGTKYTIEIMSSSIQDQSNIWSLFGGKYYPSVVCKIRRLTFDSNEIKKTEISISNVEPNIGI